VKNSIERGDVFRFYCYFCPVRILISDRAKYLQGFCLSGDCAFYKQKHSGIKVKEQYSSENIIIPDGVLDLK